MIFVVAIFILFIRVDSTWRWRDLTDNELAQWYSPADLCVMNSSTKTSFPQDIRAKDCRQFSRGNRRMFCGVGMGNNNFPCYGPYGDARPSFRRGIEGYTDASVKPLLDVTKKLVDSHSTLLFLGDSTMRQKLQAFRCELGRTDHRIRFSGDLFGSLPCDTILRVYLPDKKEFEVHGISLGPRAKACISKHFTYNISEEEVGDIISHDPTFGIAYHANKIMDRINNDQNRSVIVIANTGLWYNVTGEYTKVIGGTMKWLYERSQMKYNRHGFRLQNRVAWHETLRQHWYSRYNTGYFEEVMVDLQEAEWPKQQLDNDSKVNSAQFMVPHCCQRILNDTDWRNDIANSIIFSHPSYIKHIPIFPIASITKDIPDLHTCNPYYRHDCTHYCFTPLMYQPLWHQIRDLTSTLHSVKEVSIF